VEGGWGASDLGSRVTGWLPKIGRGPGLRPETPSHLLCNGRDGRILNRRPLDLQARIGCMARSEGSRGGGAVPCRNRSGGGVGGESGEIGRQVAPQLAPQFP